MSSGSRQTWDELNYKKMWVAYLKTHSGVHVNLDTLANEMGASKRALEDHFKTLRREARASQPPDGSGASQEDSDSPEEADMNVYQRAKRGLPPRGVRQPRGASTATAKKTAREKGTKKSQATKPTLEKQAEHEGGGVEEAVEAEASKSGGKRARLEEDDGEEEQQDTETV